jgi:hypothetical protein
MMRKTLLSLFLTVFAFAGARSVLTATPDDKSAPQWLQSAARSAVPTYQKDVPAVVLSKDTSVTVGPDGTLTTTERWAVKVLTRNGRGYADAHASYLQSSSKVKDLKAWLVRPDGSIKFYGKDMILDHVSDPDDIYDENRIKTIDATDDADVGMIFGYEAVTEERPLFTQDRFGFQWRLPTLFSRYTLNLPAGWHANSVTFNHTEIAPIVNGDTYTWELSDLQPIPPEPDALSIGNIAPRIAINYFPASASSHVYDSWHDVSKWYTDLSASSLTLDDDIAAKAKDLTANATTEFERIRAIGDFVQKIRYISLDIDVAHGGGHRPRPANVVMQRGFGDCKDKANLMRTMLKALHIESHLVLIYSGDPTYVRSEWASPGQFNHCIIAIAVGDDTKAPTVFTSEKLGRLLIFDPTDPYTQLGDLPDHEQGSYALVAAGSDGDLLKMPVLPPSSNRIERLAEVTLSPDGSITGNIRQKSYGQAASIERARLSELSAGDYNASVQKWLGARVNGGSLTKLSPLDHKGVNQFDLDLEFSAPVYAQIMQGRLMMFKPAMVGRLDQFVPVEGKRQTPILIDPSVYTETIKVRLPAGFIVDEMPEPDKIETQFGKYSSKFEIAGEYLIFSRTLELDRSIVAAANYEDVGRFFGVVRNAEAAPVVLVRK